MGMEGNRNEDLKRIIEKHTSQTELHGNQEIGEDPRVETFRPPADNYEEAGNFPDGPPEQEDAPMWPDGPMISQVEAWVRLFHATNLDVGMAEFPTGELFVWRSISRYEYKAIMAAPATTPLIREEMICELCSLWPAKYDIGIQANAKGGIPGSLAKTIMKASGFTEPMTRVL